MTKACCPKCLPNTPHACWDVTFNDNGQRVRECRNCGFTAVMRVRGEPTITTDQKAVLDRIKSCG